MPPSTRVLWSILLLLAVPLTGHGASFDCTKAQSPREKATCQSTQLSTLDETLAATYRQALAASQDADGLRREQRAWLAMVDSLWVGVQERPSPAEALAAAIQAVQQRITVLALRRDQAAAFHDLAWVGQYGQWVDICLVNEGCVGKNLNKITVLAESPSRARLQAELLFHNAHTCSFDAVGQWRGNVLHFETPGNEGPCQLQAAFDQGRVSLQANEACQYHCGARGSLHNVTLPLLKGKLEQFQNQTAPAKP